MRSLDSIKIKGRLLLVVGALLAAGCSREVQVAEEVQLVEVGRRNFEVVIDELGVVEATRTLNVVAPFSARIVRISDSGSPVKKGDVVAVLDTREVSDRLKDQVERLKVKKKELEGLVEELQIALRSNLLDISSAQAQLDLARVQLEDVNLKLGDIEYLRSREIVADDQVRDAASNMRRTQINTLARDMGLRSQVTGSLSTEKSKEIRIERTGLQGREMLARILESTDRIKEAEVRAPVDGLFLRHARWNWQTRRNQERQVGEQVGEGEALGRIPDLSSMVIRSQVPESEMLRVRPGAEVTLTFESLGNLRLPGRVVRMASLAIERETSPGGQIAASGQQLTGERVFEIEVEATEPEPRLKPGLTARVRILLESRENLLTVPLAAVHARSGRYFVVARDERGRPVRREVKVGSSNRTHVEILDGVREGETLLVNARLPEA